MVCYACDSRQVSSIAVKGEPLTSPPFLEPVTTTVLHLKKWICKTLLSAYHKYTSLKSYTLSHFVITSPSSIHNAFSFIHHLDFETHNTGIGDRNGSPRHLAAKSITLNMMMLTVLGVLRTHTTTKHPPEWMKPHFRTWKEGTELYIIEVIAKFHF
jgi:hypothetical protein